MILEYLKNGKIMSFFQEQKVKQEPEVEKPKKEKLHKHATPREQIIISGDNLIKVVDSKDDVTDGKTDILTPFGWQPFDYSIEGETQ